MPKYGFGRSKTKLSFKVYFVFKENAPDTAPSVDYLVDKENADKIREAINDGGDDFLEFVNTDGEEYFIKIEEILICNIVKD